MNRTRYGGRSGTALTLSKRLRSVVRGTIVALLVMLSFNACGSLLSPDNTDEPEDSTPTYTITYRGNGNTGGNVPVDENEYEQGEIIVVAENSGDLVRSGYAFVGWNTQQDGNGMSYEVNSSFEMGPTDVTLFAAWEELTGSLSGYVYYASTTIPVSGVTVTIGDVATTTVSDGAYRLEGLPDGTQQIDATKSGFDAYTSSVTVPATHDIEITGGSVFNLTGNVSFEGEPVQVFPARRTFRELRNLPIMGSVG